MVELDVRPMVAIIDNADAPHAMPSMLVPRLELGCGCLGRVIYGSFIEIH